MINIYQHLSTFVRIFLGESQPVRLREMASALGDTEPSRALSSSLPRGRRAGGWGEAAAARGGEGALELLSAETE
jgi:hypothetical protein